MTRTTHTGSRRARWISALALAATTAAAMQTGPFRLATTSAGSSRESRQPGFDSPDQAMEWVLLAQRDEQGNIPRDGLMRARARTDAMRRASLGQAGAAPGSAAPSAVAGISRSSWRWIGPANVGGRVRALAVHPTATSTIIAGGVAGGMWKSTNGGTSWRVIDDFMANLAVSSVVFRPGDPDRLFAGTGEGFYNSDSIRGAGIFTSTDEGESWTQLPSTANVDFDFVNRVAFSDDGGTLLAATRTGVFRSTNLGGSWTLAQSQANMMDVRFIPGSSALVVASGRNRNAYYSTNGGQSWTPSGGLSGGVSTSQRVELAVSKSAPNVVYAALDETSGQIWKSTDSGATYARISTPAHLSTQGWYDNTLWVDPTNPDHLIAGGVGLYRSINGGAVFQSISNCHVDQHNIVHDPGYNGTTNRRVYFASDGGVCKMEDVSVNTVTSLRNGLGITQFYAAGGHAGSGRVMGGTQDNGTQLYDIGAGSRVWTTEFGADGGFAAVDPTNSNILYGEIQNFRLHRSLAGGSASQYIYGGTGSQSCTKPVPFQITDACTGNANFIAPFILDPNEPNRLLAGGWSLWRSNDPRTVNTSTTGPSWAAIKPAFSGNSISAIAVAKGNSDIIWAGHNNGDLYVTLNGTAGSPTWSRTDGTLPNRMVTSIAIDAVDPRIVYVAFGGFSPDSLWRTTNSGATWQDMTGSGDAGLPDVPVRSVVQHPMVSDWLYAGTDVGVFASEDGGATWNLPHDGPANVAVFQLFWMDSTLVAVTHGRGMYMTDAASRYPAFSQRPRSQSVLPGQAVAFNVVAIGEAPLSYQWFRGQAGDTSESIPGATSGSYTTPPISSTTTYWVRVTNPAGSTNSNTAILTPLTWSSLIPGISTQGTGADGSSLNAKTSAAPDGAAATAAAPTASLQSKSARLAGGGGFGTGVQAAPIGMSAPAAASASRSSTAPGFSGEKTESRSRGSFFEAVPASKNDPRLRLSSRVSEGPPAMAGALPVLTSEPQEPARPDPPRVSERVSRLRRTPVAVTNEHAVVQPLAGPPQVRSTEAGPLPMILVALALVMPALITWVLLRPRSKSRPGS